MMERTYRGAGARRRGPSGARTETNLRKTGHSEAGRGVWSYTRSMDIRTAYETVLYRAQPFNQTHPSRLFALATLFGLEPAPLDRCRVLEVACADGGNLIPMAAEFPGSEFVGIDLAETVIRAGQEDVAALGLTNIRLEPMDLMDAGAALGPFDYVIAHGLYSWVPEPVRDRLMALVQSSLKPRGVAYVSYNALPGCRIREMFRDMMLFHVRGLEESDERLYGARELLECFVAAQAGFERPRQYLTEQAQVLIDQGPVVLFHDELGVVYHPVYFHEFLAHAGRHGLQYLTEANYYNTQSGKIPASAAAEVERLTGGNRILREQYFDFLKCRMFRQTLLCHAGIKLPDGPLPERVGRLAAASPAKPVSARPDLGPTAEEEFRGYRGAAVRTAHPLAKAVMLTLSEAWPEALRFGDLVAAAGRLTGQTPDPEAVAGILLSTLGAGLTELHARPPRVVSKPGRFPAASALARRQAGRGAILTTGIHTMVEAEGEIELRLVSLLDGTRDLSALTRELAPLLNQPEDVAAAQIEANLAKLAKMGLLEA